MVLGFPEVFIPLLVYGEEQLLSGGEWTAIGVGAGVVALAVIIAVLVRMQRKGARPRVDSCPKCDSMSVQHRAGLVVCADCGHSVKIQEVEA